MDVLAQDRPNLSACTNLSNMFVNCESFQNTNSSISTWNISNITTMKNLFNGASLFNQPLNSWDVSHVTNMSNVFTGALAFNQPLNNWDTRSVTNM